MPRIGSPTATLDTVFNGSSLKTEVFRDALQQLSAKLRNLFSVGELVKRDDAGSVQIKTLSGRAFWGKETFPYGFYAKAKKGRAFVFCQGGNQNGLNILPVQTGKDITLPELEEGDAALFTGDGGRIVLRENGNIEIDNADGDLWLTLKKGGNIDIKGGMVSIKGTVKLSGGSFECSGTVTPSGSGPFCALPFCAFTGAPQAGSMAGNT